MKKLFKNFSIYFLSEILLKIIPFLLLPIITKYLLPEEYGLYGLYQVIIGFMTPFILMNFHSHITRNFFKVSREELASIIKTLLFLLHVHIFVLMLIIYVVTKFFNNPFSFSNEILYLMPLIIYSQSINQFGFTVLRNQEKAAEYAKYKLLISVLNFVLVLYLLLEKQGGWEGLVWASLMANVLATVFFYFKLIGTFNSTVYSSFTQVYQISVPLVFHTIGGSVIILSDRLFIEYFSGIKDVGVYTLGTQIGSITMIVINTVILTINPWMYKLLANKALKMIKVYILMLLFSVVGILMYLITFYMFDYFIDANYLFAKSLIIWFVITYVIRGWYQLFFNIVVDKGETKIFMYITLGAALINLIMNYILIKLNGPLGAAQATLIAYTCLFIAIFYIVKFKWKAI